MHVKRIGILGGTFNPIHIGHLAMAQTACDQLGLDQVVFVPSNLPPHKNAKDVMSSRDRLAMVRLAILGNKNFGLCDFEVKRPGKSYSIHTIEYLRARLPKTAKLFFIIGEDSLSTLSQWKRISDLVKLVHFVVVNRGGVTRPHKSIKVRSITMPSLDISSSLLRKQIAAGKSVRYLIPEPVRIYIEKKRLYKK